MECIARLPKIKRSGMDVLYDSAINDSKGKRKKTILEN
jgi:hypothetical protein